MIERVLGSPPRAESGPPAQLHSGARRFPEPLTSFVGREKEIGEAMDLLGRVRLLTLTGPGGSGKTRLAAKLSELI